MSEPDFLSSSKIAIIGLGLMGGSLALTLRGRCQELLGCDIDEKTLTLAEQLNTFDRLSRNPGDILPDSDVVVMATPLNAILKLIDKMPDLHPGSAIIFDLGSTKTLVMQSLAVLPGRFDPLGGHPMCGKERTGLQNADAGLFEGATFAFTALERTSDKAKSFANQLTTAIGSLPFWIDADTHDRWSAAVSHLPYLVATALTAATPFESAPLVGPGFRSSTRIAATPASVMLDILETNRENILESLKKFRVEIDRLELLLAEDEHEMLNHQLKQSADRQLSLAGGISMGNIQ
jgi:prephenate dehydrogenase